MAPNILIVDDDRMLCLLLKKALERRGFCVTVLFSSQKVVNTLWSRAVSLVLCDIRMADVDGVQLLKVIRRAFPRTVVWMMSAWPDQQVLEQIQRLGAARFIQKPVDVRILAAELQALLAPESRAEGAIADVPRAAGSPPGGTAPVLETAAEVSPKAVAVGTGADCPVMALPVVAAHVTAGPDSGAEFTCYRDTVRIGTDDCCELRLKDPTVGGCHAILREQQRGFLLEDLDGPGGVILQGHRVAGVHLERRAQLQLGATQIELEAGHRFLPVPITESIPELAPLVCRSQGMQAIGGRLRLLADCDITYALTGEPGSGRRTVARWVHQTGPHAEARFVTLECGDISGPTVFRTELANVVRSSAGGTLFLSEVDRLAPEFQPALLSVLDRLSVPASEGQPAVPLRCRLACSASHLAGTSGSLTPVLPELWRRLAAVRLDLPPLRERQPDFPELVRQVQLSLCERKSLTDEAAAIEIGADAVQVLAGLRWENNLRELESVLVHALGRSRTRVLSLVDLVQALADARLGPA